MMVKKLFTWEGVNINNFSLKNFRARFSLRRMKFLSHDSNLLLNLTKNKIHMRSHSLIEMKIFDENLFFGKSLKYLQKIYTYIHFTQKIFIKFLRKNFLRSLKDNLFEIPIVFKFLPKKFFIKFFL